MTCDPVPPKAPSRITAGELLDIMTPQTQVYCNTCVYFQAPETCGHPRAYRLLMTPVTPLYGYATIQERNAQNDCPDYVLDTFRNRWRLGGFVARAKMVFLGMFVLLLLTFLLPRLGPMAFSLLRESLSRMWL